MRQIFFYCSIIILLILFQGCRNTSEIATIETIEKPSFDLQVFEKADSIKIPDYVTIQPIWWAVKNDQVVMVSPKNKDNFLYVFSLPEFNFLYKYGTYGQGPNEFVLVSWLNMLNDNQIGMYNDPNRIMYIYDLKPDTLLLNKYLKYKETEAPYNSIQQIEGSMFIFLAYYKYHTEIELVDINTGEILQTFKPILKRKTKKSLYAPYLLKVTANNDIIVLAYLFINRIELYRLNEKNFVDPFLIIGTEKNQEGKEFEDFEIYYTDIQCDDKYIYALSQQGGKRETVKNSTIEVYTLNGEPIKKITLDRHIECITIDDKNGVIYGNDSYVDFDYVYVYKLDI